MPYNKTTWQNLPNQTTPVNAQNMQKIEDELEVLASDTGWTLANLTMGTQPSADNYKCKYRKINNIVFIKGVVTELTTTGTLFTLPSGSRPATPIRFITNSGNSLDNTNLIVVTQNGYVELRTTKSTGTFEVSLDGICFAIN